jgi:ribonuclease HII
MPLPDFLDDADIIVATDEAGLGAWAGPLVVSVVAAPRDWVPRVTILTDSKKMTDAERRLAARAIQDDDCIFWATSFADSKEVDEGNVYRVNVRMHTELVATGLQRAAIRFPGKRAVAVCDGTMKIPGARSLPKADSIVLACSAASVLSKVARDTVMVEAAKTYPGYFFERNKGYGGGASHAHTIALAKLGPCPIHRQSFEPISRLGQKIKVDIFALLDEAAKKISTG